MGQASTVMYGGESQQLQNNIITEKLSKGCDLLISDPTARLAFATFMKKGTWVNKVTNIMKPTNAIPPVKGPEALNDKSVELFAGYHLPVGTLALVEKSLSRTFEVETKVSDESAAASIIETCFSTGQMKSVLLASLFPIFLESEDYANWLNKSMPKVATVSDPTINTVLVTTLATASNDEESRSHRLDGLFQPQDKRIKDIIAQAAASIDEVELENFLSSGNWLSNLLASVEDLPLCVSLASANGDRKGFPLVYVNKAFEKTTLYERSEIVGHNCKFLQSDKSEPDQIQKLTDALRYAHPCKVALTNKKKDGTEFFNLLAMKPIFNSQGEYSYVVGVQFDISNKEATATQIKLVDDLLSILPNIFK
eukprot:gene8463-11443_t